MTIKRLSIMGVGLLGGSIGLAVKSSPNTCKIVGYGHRSETLERARLGGAIDEIATDPAAAVHESDFIVLCTPVGTFERLLQQIAPALRPGALVTDVGSTKRSICKAAARILPAGVHFVGSHPMAGSERRGVEAARADLFRNALCITTPTSQTDSGALREVESFWQSLGMRITRIDPEAHDHLLAVASHLPHALAAALVLTQPDQAFPLAGKGFLDATRIAAGDGALWRDIFLDNADNLRSALTRLRQNLDRLESMLDPVHAEQLRQWLDSAAQKRRGRSDSPPAGE